MNSCNCGEHKGEFRSLKGPSTLNKHQAEAKALLVLPQHRVCNLLPLWIPIYIKSNTPGLSVAHRSASAGTWGLGPAAFTVGRGGRRRFVIAPLPLMRFFHSLLTRLQVTASSGDPRFPLWLHILGTIASPEPEWKASAPFLLNGHLSSSEAGGLLTFTIQVTPKECLFGQIDNAWFHVCKLNGPNPS